MALAEQLRRFREKEGLSLDELASKAQVSKTYLWELERDTAGEKKPSASVLLQIARALSVTIADLLELATTQVQDKSMEVPTSLTDFQERMQKLGTPLSEHDLRDLASMRFRGGQPKTADEWHQLYLTLDTIDNRKRAK
jgi:transcriptional regulator with XRE-family HTH domain